MNKYESMLPPLVRLLSEAGEIALRLQRNVKTVVDKGGGDMATEADLASQDHISRGLKKLFPGIPLVSEEQENTAVPGRDFFALDPLDGTKVYARGGRDWSITIGYVEDGRPCAGVTVKPALAEVMRAAKGAGCFFNANKVSISAPADCSALVIGVDLWKDSPAELVNRFFGGLLPRLSLLRAIGSTASAAMEVITGKMDAYVNLGASRIWDFAAAAVMVTEARGSIVALDGDEPDWNVSEIQAVLGEPQAVQTIARALSAGAR